MDDDATYTSNEGKKTRTGLTVLGLQFPFVGFIFTYFQKLKDVVKHAVKTIVHTLDSGDRLSLITYADAASVCLPLTSMTPQNQSHADVGVVAFFLLTT